MKEMMKKVKERREGFTMAELLIVVAIIAVLVAIAIPVFTAQLEKSREATDAANLRAAYAEIMADALTSETTPTARTVAVNQTVAAWASEPDWPENFTVEATTDQKKTSWSVAAVTDASGLVTGVKATIS